MQHWYCVQLNLDIQTGIPPGTVRHCPGTGATCKFIQLTGKLGSHAFVCPHTGHRTTQHSRIKGVLRNVLLSGAAVASDNEPHFPHPATGEMVGCDIGFTDPTTPGNAVHLDITVKNVTANDVVADAAIKPRAAASHAEAAKRRKYQRILPAGTHLIPVALEGPTGTFGAATDTLATIFARAATHNNVLLPDNNWTASSHTHFFNQALAVAYHNNSAIATAAIYRNPRDSFGPGPAQGHPGSRYTATAEREGFLTSRSAPTSDPAR